MRTGSGGNLGPLAANPAATTIQNLTEPLPIIDFLARFTDPSGKPVNLSGLVVNDRTVGDTSGTVSG